MKLKFLFFFLIATLNIYFVYAKIKPPCTVSISPNAATICNGQTIQLTASAGGATNFTWTPTTGLSDTTGFTVFPNPTVTTTYTAVAFGCLGSATVVVTVNPTPTALITVNSPILTTQFAGYTTFYKCATGAQTSSFFSFNNSSSPANGLNYSLDWGDGSSVLSGINNWATQSHTYNVGFYTMTYIVTNSFGCADTSIYKVFFGSTPAGGIVGPGNASGCSPLNLVFNISGTANNPPGTIYTVTFNDGSPPQTFPHPPPLNIPHTFSNTSCGTTSTDGTNVFNNSFSANFIAENPCGVSAGSVLPIYISLPVNADFTISPDTVDCVNTPVTFSDISTGTDILPAGGTTTSCNTMPPRIWKITPATGWSTSGTLGNSNGFIGSNFDPYSWTTGSQNLIVTFTTPGIYTIKLLSGNNCGPDSIVHQVCIVPIPVPSFTLNPITGCPPLNVIATNTSNTLNNCSPPTYLWIVTYTANPPCATSSSFTYTAGTSPSSINPHFSFINPGTYTITLSITNVCGTFTSTGQNIIVKAPPIISLNPIPNSCGSVTISPSLSVINCGTQNPLTYLWTFAGGTPATSTLPNPTNILFSAIGTHTITLVVTNECGFATTNTSFIITAPPNANAGSDHVICNGNSTILNGGPVGNTYSWSPSTGLSSSTVASPIANPNSTTTYVLTITDVAGCSDIDSVVVTVNPIPNINLSAVPMAICIGGSTVLTATGANSYTWNPSTGLSSTIGTSVTATPIVTTTYIVIGTSVNNCTGSQTIIVTVNPLPVLSITPNAPAICIGNNILLTVVGADTYIWSPSNTLSASTGASVTATPAITTTYTVIGTSIAGCTSTSTVVVTVTSLPGVIATSTNYTICSGQSTTLNGSGAATYSWDPTTGLSSPNSSSTSASPSATTTYTLIGMNGTNCLASDTVVVHVNPLPVINTGSPNSFCIGGSTQIGSNPIVGNTYSWTSNPLGFTSTSANPTVSPTVTTTYFLTQTITSTGCTATGSVVITVNPLPVVDAGNPISVCNQPIATTLLGYSPAGGTWSGAGVTAGGVFTPTAVGVFTLTYTYTDGNGCVNSDTIQVTVINPTQAIAGTGFSICVDAASYNLSQVNPTPTGGTWGGSGVSGGSFSPTGLNGVQILTYTIGAGTCLSSDTIHVTVNPLPNLNVNSASFCIGNSATLTVTGANTYTWTPSTGLSTTTGNSVTANPTATTTYTITGTVTATGCTNTATSTVTVNPLPVVDAGNPISVCNQPIATTLTGYTPTGGTWTGAGVTAGGIFTPTAVGVFTLNYTYTDGNGCVNSDTIQVTVINPTQAVAGIGFSICVDAASYNLSQANPTPSGGTWSGSGVSGGSFSPTGLNGVQILTYTIGAGTCLSSDTIHVTVNPLPNMNVNSPTFCTGSSVALTVTGANAYTWSPSTGLSATTGSSVTANPTNTTTYTITGTVTATGCINTTISIVTVNPLPVVDAGNPISVCNQPIATTLTGYTPTGGTWTGTGVTAGGVFTPTAVGVFTLTYTYTDGNGCVNSDTIQVTVINPTQAVAGTGFSICVDAASYNLNLLNATPSGGTWSGTGVSGGSFSPNGLNGVQLLTYTIGAGTCLSSDTIHVTVNPLPNLNVNSPTICTGSSAVLTVTGANAYTWTPSTGLNATTGSSVTANSIITTTYTITGTVTATGCTNTTTSIVTVNPLPVVDAGNPISVCNQPIATTLVGYTPTGGTWTGTGVTVGGVFTPTAVGVFILTYTFTNLNGCVNSDTISVSVVAPQIANAGIGFSICQNSVQVILSGYTPSGGTWSGNGLNGNTFTPTGLNGVQILTYTFGTGTCLTTDTLHVLVNAEPVISVNSPIICEGETATLNANGANSYIWTPSTGLSITTGSSVTANPTITTTYNISGTETLTGCSNTTTTIVTVNPLPIVNFNLPSSGCPISPVNIINSTTGASTYLWSFGDGGTSGATNPSHTYSSFGNYTVTLIATSTLGCIDSLSQMISIVPPPTVSFSLSDTIGCEPLSIAITNNSTVNLSYQWDFGNGQTSTAQNPGTIIFNSGIVGDTTYYITLTVSYFCGNVSYNDSVRVLHLPVSYFGIDANVGCSPDTVFFSNNSYGQPTSYLWNFGNGTTSTLQNPPPVIYYAFTNDTTYTISLTAFNSCGDSTTTDTVLVHPNSVNAFINANPIIGCAPLAVNFTNFTTGATIYNWNFGDGNFSNAYSVVHTYQNAGTYLAIMSANDGCSFASDSVLITVNPQPIVNFTVNQNSFCLGELTVFNNLSIGTSNSLWIFGDGTTSTLFNPTHTYNAPGQYIITLIGTAAGTGCTDSAIVTVTINSLPTVNFTPDILLGCQPLTVSFSNQSSGASFYSWDFGDGNTSAMPAPVHTFLNAGTFTVQLVGTNAFGCTDTVISTITVFPKPIASFTSSSLFACDFPADVQFTNTSVGANNYQWDFGNGITSTQNNPNVQYNSYGAFTVTLIASNQFGCSDTATFVFNVYQTPVADFDFGPFVGCDPFTISFSNESLFGINCLWNFGDGSTSTMLNPIHTYTSPGIYSVTLIAIGGGGCADTINASNIVTVHPTPIANFVCDTLNLPAPNATVHFTNESENAISYFWNFGDGNTSTEENPSHNYLSNDRFMVMLIAFNNFGCSDTVYKWVEVYFIHSLNVPNAFTPYTGPWEDRKFTPKGIGIQQYDIWIYDVWGTTILWHSDKLDAQGSPTESWDGIFNGEMMPQDAYVWKVVAIFRDGTPWEGKHYKSGEIKPTGTVTLLR